MEMDNGSQIQQMDNAKSKISQAKAYAIPKGCIRRTA